jgi:hypothetical protein
MTMFTQQDYARLHDLVFRPGYPGYRPNVVEIPNGDGKADTEKRFAHVAQKYLNPERPYIECDLWGYLATAHALALRVARALHVPEAFLPRMEFGALRVLEYPIGAVTNLHTDFDLFTLLLYRTRPDRFVSDWHNMPAEVSALNAQAHLGEIAEEIGLGKATRHEVLPCDEVQHSIVYFAIPEHAAKLPNGMTVSEWLTERLSRSRVYG